MPLDGLPGASEGARRCADVIRALRALIFFVVLSVSCSAAFAAPVKMAKIASSTPAYDITVTYPQIGVPAVDADIAAWAKDQADATIRAARSRRPDSAPYYLEITPQVVRNDAQMFEVVFNIGQDQGWAHPTNDYASLNYLMPDGSRFLLAEALRPGAFRRISELAIADVGRQMIAQEGTPPDPEMAKSGAAPYAENFQSFAFTAKDLIVYFGAGQIDAYAVGPQEAHIPLAQLTGLLRGDWRAPLASFDCARAKSGIEKTICSDRVLARLDRQVADMYARSLREATLMARRPEDFRQAQRAFIAKRDKDCEGTGAAEHTCLINAYRARYAAMKAAEENP